MIYQTKKERYIKIRKVKLSLDRQEKYEIIKSLVDHKGNKKRAAIKLNCTLRTVNRLIQKYLDYGKEGFVHGNQGKTPVHAFSASDQKDITNLYTNKYANATFAHASELLKKHDNIKISPSALAKILYAQNIVSPRTKKVTKKVLKAKLLEEMKKTGSKKKKERIQAECQATKEFQRTLI